MRFLEKLLPVDFWKMDANVLLIGNTAIKKIKFPSLDKLGKFAQVGTFLILLVTCGIKFFGWLNRSTLVIKDSKTHIDRIIEDAYVAIDQIEVKDNQKADEIDQKSFKENLSIRPKYTIEHIKRLAEFDNSIDGVLKQTDRKIQDVLAFQVKNFKDCLWFHKEYQTYQNLMAYAAKVQKDDKNNFSYNCLDLVNRKECNYIQENNERHPERANLPGY